jgi:hypothetical protein
VIVQRRAPRRRPLVNGQRLDVARDGRRDLHAARPGADDGHPLPGEAHRLPRPPARMVGLTREGRAAGHVRVLRHRQHARRAAEAPRPDLEAVGGPRRPRRRGLVPGRRGHLAAQADVPAQAEPVDHVVEVRLGLRLRGELLRPVPLLPQVFGEEVPVGVALRVEPAAGVAVPVPGAADAVALLQQPHRVAGRAGPVQLVEAEDAGADDHQIDVGPGGTRTRGRRAAFACCHDLPARRRRLVRRPREPRRASWSGRSPRRRPGCRPGWRRGPRRAPRRSSRRCTRRCCGRCPPRAGSRCPR